MTTIGIHDLAVATASHVVELDDLAARADIDPAKFRIGLGQEQMSIPGLDEDIVTMGAAAAQRIIDRHGVDGIRTLFFATETGIDQSRAAGVHVHELLGLPRSVRVVELKQACYSATAALQAAAGLIARNPDERVLVIASDVARYELDTAAEPTQGAGAVAFLVSAEPALAVLETAAGVYTAEVDDFWRPNDSVTAVVDGKLSVSAYLDGVAGAWDDYRSRGGVDIDQIDWFCHHQPFTKMAVKAHRALGQHVGVELDPELVTATTGYNRRIGNSYTASLYIALAALLDGENDLTGSRIGLFSYGSGSVSEFFTLVVQPGYREATRGAETEAILAARTAVDVPTYRELHDATHRDSTVDVEIAAASPGPFHFAGLAGRARRYTRD
ncbi:MULTISPECIES: hydroxymethylglutaryl-CoA synthase [Microbacterium]|uniref:hydroxymethylglutaryl-CoA synthase n=1 Tax=Microbacterium TaxID=33882 RepID=UPI000DCE4CB5|nr:MULTISPECIES: hydroxymethylglutaryl-CoA synthase [Microbacterium]MCZ4066243.1 hydroxymethylglutaryl-CoA synthase [Microbacterium sp. H37-C3]RAZ35019.1 hydroxymethylglutaryl-CoA synthase [Microbacterium sp. SMR1]WRK15907.1 hydroxymethylglutaryl-CoA synthase [Microbacterium plantarum]